MICLVRKVVDNLRLRHNGSPKLAPRWRSFAEALVEASTTLDSESEVAMLHPVAGVFSYGESSDRSNQSSQLSSVEISVTLIFTVARGVLAE